MPPTPQTVAKFPVWSVLIKHARRWAEPFGIEARAHHSSPKVLAEFTGEPRYAIDLVHIDPDTDQVLALATVSVCVLELRRPGFGKLFRARLAAGVANLLASYAAELRGFQDEQQRRAA